MPKKSSKKIAKYVDGYLLVVPKKKLAAYRKMAKEAGELWMKHGALSYKECVGDDLNPELSGCPYLPFGKLLKLKPSETVWYSYIEYKSKADRNRINAKIEKEMEKLYGNDASQMKDMPFDMKKMSFGGFKVDVGY